MKNNYKENRVIVDNKYTYATSLDLKVGDKVRVPSPAWLADIRGPSWIGTVTDTTSTYQGNCVRIIEKV